MRDRPPAPPVFSGSAGQSGPPGRPWPAPPQPHFPHPRPVISTNTPTPATISVTLPNPLTITPVLRHFFPVSWGGLFRVCRSSPAPDAPLLGSGYLRDWSTDHVSPKSILSTSDQVHLLGTGRRETARSPNPQAFDPPR